MLMVTGVFTAAGWVAAGFAPPQAASIKLAMTRTNINLFMLLSFLQIKFDNRCQIIWSIRIQPLCQRTMKSQQLQHWKIQDPAYLLRDSRIKFDIRLRLAQACHCSPKFS